MCITQIWTYRECGCRYHRLVPCHPSFNPSSTTPRRRCDRNLSNTSSSSDRSPTSTNGSPFTSGDLFPSLNRQCSIRHFVQKNFLEPICDDCLVEELGLQPEFGSRLGGRDLKEGLNGEEWILESTVEINIEEEEDDDRITSSGRTEDEDAAAEADDEGEFRGRSERRRGIDISRDTLHIGSNLSMEEQEALAPFGKELRSAEPEGGNMARAANKAREQGRCLKPSWLRQLRKGPPRARKGGKQSTGVLPVDYGSVNSLQHNLRIPFSSNKELVAGSLIPEDDEQLSSIVQPDDARETPFDAREQIMSLYETNPEYSRQEVQHPSWLQHLHSDLHERHAMRKHPAVPLIDPETPEQYDRLSSSVPSSPQATMLFNLGDWTTYEMQALNIASSEFDDEDFNLPPHPTTPPQVPLGVQTHADVDSASIASTLSTSTFHTAHSSLSSPSTRPTTAASTSNIPAQLSTHPISTTLSICAPHRPPLAPRTSSLHAPPASSRLLHSTPPLHQSPTSAFVCVHERWAFRVCGCEGPSLVRSCICDPTDKTEGEEREGDRGERRGKRDDGDTDSEERDTKDGCRASSPMVRTRWFFNESCEECLERDAAGGETPGDSR
jgi:hypothetical protein